MHLTDAFILFLIMLALVVQLVPVAAPWGKLAVWLGLTLITVLLMVAGVVRFG
jgi:hypothetical protein